MGLRGPQPTPTAILAARGSWRAAARGSEPKPTVAEPVPPEGRLDDYALAMWMQVAPELYRLGLLTVCDVEALCQYCEAYQTYRECQELVKHEGKTCKGGKNAAPYPNPNIATGNKAADKMMKLAQRFGFDPASRARLSADPPAEHDDSFFTGGGE